MNNNDHKQWNNEATVKHNDHTQWNNEATMKNDEPKPMNQTTMNNNEHTQWKTMKNNEKQWKNIGLLNPDYSTICGICGGVVGYMCGICWWPPPENVGRASIKMVVGTLCPVFGPFSKQPWLTLGSRSWCVGCLGWRPDCLWLKGGRPWIPVENHQALFASGIDWGCGEVHECRARWREGNIWSREGAKNKTSLKLGVSIRGCH